MAETWVAVAELKNRLHAFFGQQKKELNRFGSTVNQTFEAFVFAQVVGWYKTKPGWTVKMVNPKDQKTKKEIFRLKFSTKALPTDTRTSYVRRATTDRVFRFGTSSELRPGTTRRVVIQRRTSVSMSP